MSVTGVQALRGWRGELSSSGSFDHNPNTNPNPYGKLHSTVHPHRPSSSTTRVNILPPPPPPPPQHLHPHNPNRGAPPQQQGISFHTVNKKSTLLLPSFDRSNFMPSQLWIMPCFPSSFLEVLIQPGNQSKGDEHNFYRAFASGSILARCLLLRSLHLKAVPTTNIAHAR